MADLLATAVLVLAAAAALLPSAVASILRPDRIGGVTTERALRAVILVGLLLVVLASIAVARQSGRTLGFRNGTLALALLAYWVAGMGSLLWNDRPLPQLSALAIPLMVVALAGFGGGPQLGVRVLGYSLLGVCYASLALAIVYPRAAFPSGPGFEESRYLGFLADNRLAGVSNHPNTLGLLAAITAVLMLVHRVGPWHLHVCVAVLVLLLSESRATIVALALAVSVLVGMSKTRDGRRAIHLVRTIAVFDWTLIVLLPFLAAIGLMSISFNGRTSIWEYALSRIDEHVSLGFGPGVWADFIAKGRLADLATSGHNQFVESLATVGVLGVVLLSVIAVFWLRYVSPSRCAEFLFAAAAFALVWSVAIFEAPIGLWGVNPESWLILTLTISCLGLSPSPSFNARLTSAGAVTDEARRAHAAPPR